MTTLVSPIGSPIGSTTGQVNEDNGVSTPNDAIELQLVADGAAPAPSSDEPELERISVSDDDDHSPQDPSTLCARWYLLRRRLRRQLGQIDCLLKTGILAVCLCLFLAYFSYAMYLHHDSRSIVGLVVIATLGGLVALVRLVSRYEPLAKIIKFFSSHRRISRNLKRFVTLACVITTCVTLVTEVILVRPASLVSLSGIAAIFLIFLITSTHPHMISWRLVLSGFFLQYVFALAILRIPAVHGVFLWCGEIITQLVEFSKKGGEFIFGRELYRQSGFVFHFIPLMAFVFPILAMLEHLGVLDALLKIVGRFLAFCTGASPVEALNASANIFMGPIDSIMIVRPYLKDLTPSELHCLMANGMSTVTGSIMGLYIAFGISADHLLVASVMSAPAALAVAKLAVPETRRRQPDGVAGVMLNHETRYKSLMDAASSGAVSSLALAGAVIANVAAVSSFIAMINAFLTWLGGLVDVRDLTLQRICSYLFYPLALALGVDSQDARTVAELLGIKVFLNEVIAYDSLGGYIRNRERYEKYLGSYFTEWSRDDGSQDVFLAGWNETLKGGFISFRSEVITTYALCGFANFVSVGIIVGCYIVLIPHRKMVVFQYVLRSMFVGHSASFLTACIAGMFIQ